MVSLFRIYLSFFAILKLGATVCPVNSMFKREKAKFLVEDVGAKAIICSIDKIGDSINISSRVDRVKHIISHLSP